MRMESDPGRLVYFYQVIRCIEVFLIFKKCKTGRILHYLLKASLKFLPLNKPHLCELKNAPWVKNLRPCLPTGRFA